MTTPNEDVRKCVEGVAKLIEESLPVVYYATHESIEDNKVYQFSNPEWFLLSPGDFEKLKKDVEGKVRLKHVREMPVEEWPRVDFMMEFVDPELPWRIGTLWGLMGSS
jgi:hypothetical protein